MASNREKKILHRGKYLQLCESEGWEWVERVGCSGVVMILPLTQAGEAVLIDQYRLPLGKRVVEFPAGLVGDNGAADESLETAALRELEEETGFTAAGMSRVAFGPPSAGLSPESVVIFLATGLSRIGEGGGDDTEDIEVAVVPLAEVDGWLEKKVSEGCLIDPKVYAGLYFLKNHRRNNQ
ncbi:MAG TPA: NUDIX hydrolase [bacterium]|nr:NUDIX hydrolase [bacterium]